MLYNGKNVLSQADFSYSDVKIGDYVTQEVVDDAIDCLPPACMGPRCSQMGEPCDERIDPDTGEWRMTYHTFKKVDGGWPNGIWQYCDRCFRGKIIERSKPLSFVSEGDGRNG